MWCGMSRQKLQLVEITLSHTVSDAVTAVEALPGTQPRSLADCAGYLTSYTAVAFAFRHETCLRNWPWHAPNTQSLLVVMESGVNVLANPSSAFRVYPHHRPDVCFYIVARCGYYDNHFETNEIIPGMHSLHSLHSRESIKLRKNSVNIRKNTSNKTITCECCGTLWTIRRISLTNLF